MPIPIPGDDLDEGVEYLSTPPTTAGQPFWMPDSQQYAVDQERFRHINAVDFFGEYSIFVLMWSIYDFNAGRIDRCATCYKNQGLIADVYAQPSDAKCPDCLGTTFSGGYKARIVRRAVWDDNEHDDRLQRRGETLTQTATVQSTHDFRLRTGDYILRADGTRWQMRTLSANELHTGFGVTMNANAVLGYNYGTCNRIDPSSVGYLIPPDDATVAARLDLSHVHHPMEFADLEDIRGPLDDS